MRMDLRRLHVLAHPPQPGESFTGCAAPIKHLAERMAFVCSCAPAVGGTAQEVGEGTPLDKEGAVGKQFTTDGAIGECDAAL